MNELIVAIFAIVDLGMILGSLPILQLDRTGVARLGAIALIGTEAVGLEEAAPSIHLPTLILLFSFMVVSAPMRRGGFHDRVTQRPPTRSRSNAGRRSRAWASRRAASPASG